MVQSYLRVVGQAGIIAMPYLVGGLVTTGTQVLSSFPTIGAITQIWTFPMKGGVAAGVPGDGGSDGLRWTGLPRRRLRSSPVLGKAASGGHSRGD